MTKTFSIAGLTAAALMLGMSFAAAQAPTPGRADQSGGGAAEMSAKPAGSPEAMRRPMMKHMTKKQRMARHKSTPHQKPMTKRDM
ncbi:MAG: hypothetical protein JWM36_620 [Hyphomicrobiales bacterium]|nr:hypothetical protein [Hyphomicrobiales bacterium]